MQLASKVWYDAGTWGGGRLAQVLGRNIHTMKGTKFFGGRQYICREAYKNSRRLVWRNGRKQKGEGGNRIGIVKAGEKNMHAHNGFLADEEKV